MHFSELTPGTVSCLQSNVTWSGVREREVEEDTSPERERERETKSRTKRKQEPRKDLPKKTCKIYLLDRGLKGRLVTGAPVAGHRCRRCTDWYSTTNNMKGPRTTPYLLFSFSYGRKVKNVAVKKKQVQQALSRATKWPKAAKEKESSWELIFTHVLVEQ